MKIKKIKSFDSNNIIFLVDFGDILGIRIYDNCREGKSIRIEKSKLIKVLKELK